MFYFLTFILNRYSLILILEMKPFNTIEVKSREIGKKSIIKKILNDNNIPGIIYLKGSENLNIQVSTKQLNSIINDPSAFTRLYELKYEGKSIMCILKEVQFNPAIDLPRHIDFQEVKSGEKVIVNIPVKIINKEICPGVKNGGDIYKLSYNVKLKCDVEKIPYAIEIDVKNSNMGDKYFLSDIPLPEGCQIIKNVILIRVAGKRVLKEEATTTADSDTSTAETATTDATAATQQNGANNVASK